MRRKGGIEGGGQECLGRLLGGQLLLVLLLVLLGLKNCEKLQGL